MNHNDVIISGKDVTKSYYSNDEPFITHGLFHFQNNTALDKKISIQSLKCIAGHNTFEVTVFYIYKLPEYQEIKDSKIVILANESFCLEISFPRISALSYNSGNIFIELKMRHDDQLISAKSFYHLEIRTKSQDYLTR